MELLHPDDREFERGYALIMSEIRAAEKRAGRPEGSAQLMAVTKNFDCHAYELAKAAGIKHIGENRVQEAEAKYADGHDGVTLHLIGHLQTNKAAKAAAVFDTVDSVDSPRLAAALDAACAKLGKVMPVMAEINIGDDPDKTGAPTAEAQSLCEYIEKLPNLSLYGFMTILPVGCDDEGKTQYFEKFTKKTIDICNNLMHNEDTQLSMGMSGDYVQAVMSGSTMVRIGTALFGKRR